MGGFTQHQTMPQERWGGGMIWGPNFQHNSIRASSKPLQTVMVTCSCQQVCCACLQSFAEKLFTQLNVRYKKETWETRLAMITVTARVIGVHKLLMDEKYYASYLNLVQPRQRDVTHVLAALIMVTAL